MSAYSSTSWEFNRTYKDTVFRDLFGSEERKENTLSLYNALAGTSYTNIDDLQMTTISGAIYMGFKNDVSFIVGEELVLWEHQSTKNPNMPLRGLFYYAELYASYAQQHNLNRFSTARLELPTPKYYVFYTGREPMSERETLRLSDSFKVEGCDLEVVATVLDVREGANKAIMDACQVLADYAHFVTLARDNSEVMDPRAAIDAAVMQCISEGRLADYLTERRAEVVSWMLTEWDEEKEMALMRQEAKEFGLKEGLEEGRKEGLKEGLKEGRAEGRAEAKKESLNIVAGLVRDGILDVESAAERFGFSVDELAEVL